MKNYSPWEIEPKWQKIWRKKKIFQPDMRRAKKPFYNLMMFPYPSAEGLHVGNMYAFTGADIYGRFKRMQGFDVFQPIGLDGFGIHSENYALKIGEHPAKVAQRTEKNFYRQLQATGNAYAWENTLETYDPDYYRWTQWIFVKLFKAGLVERKKAPVNFCPSCKTTLSDEQVLPAGRQGIAGRCERCKTEVEKKHLEQWFFKITKYAERLLKNLEWIDWSERTKIAQRNWIGRSEGAQIKFQILNSKLQIPVFTTRPDTIFGATFFVIAPESEWVEKLTTPENRLQVEKYIKISKKKSEVERTAPTKEKTGVFTGSYVVNPATGKPIPVWVADYVILEYGTGAVMGVPAHDQRDWDFAKKYNLPIIPVIEGGDVQKAAWEGEGTLINSGKFNGLPWKKAAEEITRWLAKRGLAKKEVRYHLRDWCVSRQRYWGPPIPMIYCQHCAQNGVGEKKELPGWFTVPESELPVLLPYLKNYQPRGFGKPPLAQAKRWLSVSCPHCGRKARREVEVSDTFLDSAWYFFRYPTIGQPSAQKFAFYPQITKKWLPVDMYIGGHEHACLHLMYSRFITMVFKDLGLIDFEEPYKRFYAHGLIIAEGAKMSKSKGNVVIPDEYIEKFGADTLRCYLMFLGPFDQGGDFRDRGIAGMYRFLNRIWRIYQGGKKIGSKTSPELLHPLHQTIQKVTNDINNLRYNTAIAAMMEFINQWNNGGQLSKADAGSFLKLLAPFAPHLAEELWHSLTKFPTWEKMSKTSIHLQPWPKYDPKLVEEEEATIVVQVNGKVRGQIKIQSTKSKIQNEVEKLAKADPRVAKYLAGHAGGRAGKPPKKVIFVPGKLINFVL